MQNLGTLDNQYIILPPKLYGRLRKKYHVRQNQNQNEFLIELPIDNNINAFPANEINILNILQNIDNPNIIHYIGNGNGPLVLNGRPPVNKPYLVFEYAPRHDLYDYIRIGRFTERQAKLIFKKILNGIRAIHNAGICHRDIKPANILLDENYNPKIGDYYSACLNANNLQGLVGTIMNAAPEIILNQPYDGIKCDIFSLGQLLFILVTGLPGFEIAIINDPLYSLIRQQNYAAYWNRPELVQLNLSDNFKNLFVRMVAFNPNQRPSIEQILNDVWMQEINNLNAEQMNTLENEVRNELQNREAQIPPNLDADILEMEERNESR
jgi:BR serine/threonine kinase